MTLKLNGHFTLHFHYHELRFQQLCYILIVESIYGTFFVVGRHQQRCAEADRDPQNIAIVCCLYVCP